MGESPMLEITKQADYALRAALEVAALPDGERIPTAQIAIRQHIPHPFLTKIVAQLVTRRIFESTRGANGGINLARSADTISVLEIIEAIDGPLTLYRHSIDDGIEQDDTLSQLFDQARAQLEGLFGSITLCDLLDKAEKKQNLRLIAKGA